MMDEELLSPEERDALDEMVWTVFFLLYAVVVGLIVQGLLFPP